MVNNRGRLPESFKTQFMPLQGNELDSNICTCIALNLSVFSMNLKASGAP